MYAIYLQIRVGRNFLIAKQKKQYNNVWPST